MTSLGIPVCVLLDIDGDFITGDRGLFLRVGNALAPEKDQDRKPSMRVIDC